MRKMTCVSSPKPGALGFPGSLSDSGTDEVNPARGDSYCRVCLENTGKSQKRCVRLSNGLQPRFSRVLPMTPSETCLSGESWLGSTTFHAQKHPGLDFVM